MEASWLETVATTHPCYTSCSCLTCCSSLRVHSHLYISACQGGDFSIWIGTMATKGSKRRVTDAQGRSSVSCQKASVSLMCQSSGRKNFSTHWSPLQTPILLAMIPVVHCLSYCEEGAQAVARHDILACWQAGGSFAAAAAVPAARCWEGAAAVGVAGTADRLCSAPLHSRTPFSAGRQPVRGAD